MAEKLCLQPVLLVLALQDIIPMHLLG